MSGVQRAGEVRVVLSKWESCSVLITWYCAQVTSQFATHEPLALASEAFKRLRVPLVRQVPLPCSVLRPVAYEFFG
jgi:hypothetical protein